MNCHILIIVIKKVTRRIMIIVYLIKHLYATDPGMAMDLELSVTGSEPGKVSETIYCYVMNLDDPLHLHVEAEFKVITQIVFMNLSGDYEILRSYI